MHVNEAEEYYKRINLFSKVNRLAVLFHNANPKLKSMAAIDLDNDEIISFLKSLKSANVKYLLVGGSAVSFNGLVRATHDLDLWINAEEKNLWIFRNVLIKHRTEDYPVTEFTQFSLGQSGFVVDPMKHLKVFSDLILTNVINVQLMVNLKE
jgi:hypothetical protein